MIGSTPVYVLPSGKALCTAPATDCDDDGAIEVFCFENVNDEQPKEISLFDSVTLDAIEEGFSTRGKRQGVLVQGAFEAGFDLTEVECGALDEAEAYCKGKDVAFNGPFYF